jgi:hypothetical protein
MPPRKDPAALDGEDRLAGYKNKDLVPDAITCWVFGVTAMTLYRWERIKGFGFPAAIKVNGHNYRLAGELRQFRKKQAGF